MSLPRVAVIGAGPAGLGAADRLSAAGLDVTVFERSDIPGGLSATYRMDGYGFDMGGHRLITRNQAVVDLAKELLGDDLIDQPRVSKILFRRRFFNQPLEMGDAFRTFELGFAARAGLSYLVAQARRAFAHKDDAASFEEWVIERFGRHLYDAFFGPYTAKVWGVDPSRIAPEWAPRRIMIPGLARLVRAILQSEAKRPATTARTYLYPRHGSGQLYEALAARCEANGAVIRYGRTMETIAVDADSVQVVTSGADGTAAETFDHVVSTAPLPNLVRAITPSEPSAIAASNRLEYRGITFVFLQLDRQVLLGWDALYVPEPEYVFFRLEEPKYWSADLVREGTTSLCAEIASSPGDELWELSDDELVERTIADLCRCGFVTSRHEVTGARVVRAAHVYPLQLVDTEPIRQHCLDFVASLAPRVFSVGRQGCFRYLDMDESIQMGWGAAECILGETQARELYALDQERSYLWDARREVASVADG